MWKLTIKQYRTTSSGYEVDEYVEFVSNDISKLTRIVEYFSDMTNKKTEYSITKKEEDNDGE